VPRPIDRQKVFPHRRSRHKLGHQGWTLITGDYPSASCFPERSPPKGSLLALTEVRASLLRRRLFRVRRVAAAAVEPGADLPHTFKGTGKEP